MAQSKKEKSLITLTAGKSVFGGYCLSRVEERTFFLERSLPGETAEAEVLSTKKDYSRAKTVRVIQSSPMRREPSCAHYDYCQGCQYQHVEYAEELRLKHSQVVDLFDRATGFGGLVEPPVAGPSGRHYRKSVTFHLASPGKRAARRFAYIGEDNQSPVILKQCELLDPALEALLPGPGRDFFKKDKVTFKIASSGEVISDEKEVFFRVKIGDKSFLAHSQGFFQINWEVTRLMAEAVQEDLTRRPPEIFFDLFAGVGTFSILCAEDYERIAVEESPHSLAALRMNRDERLAGRLQVVEGRVERVFPGLWEKNASSGSVILLDPPRMGLEKQLAEYISKSVSAARLIYISCDPATLARDLKILLGGGWRLERVKLFDMFPRTKHIESIAFLEKLL